MVRSVLRNAWGDFLSGVVAWDWFLTLTFREPVPSFRAYRLFAKFCREIEKAAGQPIAWFRGDEYGPRGGRLHLHALMANVAHLRRLDWMDWWERLAGFARITAFDNRRGAAYYVAKYVTKGQGGWDLSGLPLETQLVMAIPVIGRAKVLTATKAPCDARQIESQSSPDVVRRRRPDRLNWHRHDWETAMLQKRDRWTGSLGGGTEV